MWEQVVLGGSIINTLGYMNLHCNMPDTSSNQYCQAPQPLVLGCWLISQGLHPLQICLWGSKCYWLLVGSMINTLCYIYMVLGLPSALLLGTTSCR